MGFNCLKATATSRREFTFYHSVPRNFSYSFYRPQKDERLSQPWSHPVVLNTGPLDWESIALTTRPLLSGSTVYQKDHNGRERTFGKNNNKVLKFLKPLSRRMWRLTEMLAFL